MAEAFAPPRLSSFLAQVIGQIPKALKQRKIPIPVAFARFADPSLPTGHNCVTDAELLGDILLCGTRGVTESPALGRWGQLLVAKATDERRSRRRDKFGGHGLILDPGVRNP